MMGSGRSGNYSGTHGSRNSLPKNKAQIKHIFRKGGGHLVDTSKNRKTLERIANNKKLYKGTDIYGKKWYIEPCKNGGQHWVSVKNGKIQDGGYNRTPVPWNGKTGLCRPLPPVNLKKKKCGGK
ncbi:MAG: hypothetical protein K6G18_11540 [Treponema sp.]|nr:hypothetical protein [Treponema sp.]